MTATLPFLAACAVTGNEIAYRTLNPELSRLIDPTLKERVDAHIRRHRAFPDIDSLNAMLEAPVDATTFRKQASIYRDEMAISEIRTALATQMKIVQAAITAKSIDEITGAIQALAARVQRINPENLAVERSALLSDVRRRVIERRWAGTTLIPFGWPTMDRLCFGMTPGDVFTVVARPNIGKSMILARMALKANLAGFRVLLITPEMTNEQFNDRLIGMEVGINPNQIARATITTDKLHEVMRLADAQRAAFHIANGAGLSMNDIRGMVERLRPDALFIDAAYLIKGAGKFEKGWEVIKSNFEGMKGIASDYRIPVANAVQLNREGGKEIADRRKAKEKSKDDFAPEEEEAPSLENIAGGDTIGQISSVVVIAEKGMAMNRETRRRLWIAKNRSDKLGNFEINYLMSPPDLSEIEADIPIGSHNYDDIPDDGSDDVHLYDEMYQ